MKLRSPSGAEKLNFFLSKHENSGSELIESLYGDFIEAVNYLAKECPCPQPRKKKGRKKGNAKNRKP